MRIHVERALVYPLLVIAILSVMGLVAADALLTATGPPIGRLVVMVAISGPLLLWMVPGMIRDLRVYFTDEGVHRPRLFLRGEQFIAWAAVDRVTATSAFLRLHSGRRRITVQLLAVKDPDAVRRLIHERVQAKHPPA